MSSAAFQTVYALIMLNRARLVKLGEGGKVWGVGLFTVMWNVVK